MSQIRTLGMLRSRFDSIPLAVHDCLVPAETSDGRRKKGLKSNLQKRFKEVLLHFVYKFLRDSCTLLLEF
jgi:callose synthase